MNNNQEKYFLNELEKEDQRYGDRKKTRKKMLPYKRDHSHNEYEQLLLEQESEDDEHL